LIVSKSRDKANCSISKDFDIKADYQESLNNRIEEGAMVK